MSEHRISKNGINMSSSERCLGRFTMIRVLGVEF